MSFGASGMQKVVGTRGQTNKKNVWRAKNAADSILVPPYGRHPWPPPPPVQCTRYCLGHRLYGCASSDSGIHLALWLYICTLYIFCDHVAARFFVFVYVWSLSCIFSGVQKSFFSSILFLCFYFLFLFLLFSFTVNHKNCKYKIAEREGIQFPTFVCHCIFSFNFCLSIS